METVRSYEQYKVDVPEGQSGPWSIQRFTISECESDVQNKMASFAFTTRGTRSFPGTYTMLLRGNVTVMSDIPPEIEEHMEMIEIAKGNILIVGLGIGMVAQACLRKPEVEHLTVVELSPDVIQLTGGHIKSRFGDRLEIIQSSIFEWEPPDGVHYDAVWFDIWDVIGECNLPQMEELKNRFRPISDWQGCWAEDLCSKFRNDSEAWAEQVIGR